MTELWDIDEGIADLERFFKLVPDLLPEATHLFIEGSSVAGDVETLYARFADPGPYLPRRQTLWPRSKIFRCVAARPFFDELADLSVRHAAPEVLDHLSIYERDRMLLDWHDAFANALLLDGSLPETTVARLAGAFGVEYGRARGAGG